MTIDSLLLRFAQADFALFLHEQGRSKDFAWVAAISSWPEELSRRRRYCRRMMRTRQELLDLWALDLARAADWSALHPNEQVEGEASQPQSGFVKLSQCKGGAG